MDLIYNKTFLKHSSDSHPECPERLSYFESQTKQTKIENGKKYLKLIYDQTYINLIQEASKNQRWLDPDTYTNKNSFVTACYAVGATIKAAYENNFALTRPPGHHATQNKAMGFCLFNNIALASEFLRKNGKKIFILDFDEHSGNGTQDIFYNSNEILYLSTHVFPYYPGTGWVNEIGVNEGKGYNINIPLPPGSADDLLFESLNFILPIIKDQFKPDILAVSAGFDGYNQDPLSSLNFTSNTYYKLGKVLTNNFNNIFACLEGGYKTDTLHKLILSFQQGINKQQHKFPEDDIKSEDNTKEEFNKRFEELKQNLRPYWNL